MILLKLREADDLEFDLGQFYIHLLCAFSQLIDLWFLDVLASDAAFMHGFQLWIHVLGQSLFTGLKSLQLGGHAAGNVLRELIEPAINSAFKV